MNAAAETRRIEALRNYPTAATVADVVREMKAKGYVCVYAGINLGTTPRRAARAIRALGFSARERRTIHDKLREKHWTLWTSAEGAEAAVIVSAIAMRLVKPPGWNAQRNGWGKRKIPLEHVARYYAEHRDQLAEFSTAYRLDAPASVLETMLEPVRRALLLKP